jgi:hypothetical protein
MRRFEGHQQGETKRDEAVFTESAAVKVSYNLLGKSTPSRHNRAILGPEQRGLSEQTSSLGFSRPCFLGVVVIPLLAAAPSSFIRICGILWMIWRFSLTTCAARHIFSRTSLPNFDRLSRQSFAPS